MSPTISPVSPSLSELPPSSPTSRPNKIGEWAKTFFSRLSHPVVPLTLSSLTLIGGLLTENAKVAAVAALFLIASGYKLYKCLSSPSVASPPAPPVSQPRANEGTGPTVPASPPNTTAPSPASVFRGALSDAPAFTGGAAAVERKREEKEEISPLSSRGRAGSSSFDQPGRTFLLSPDLEGFGEEAALQHVIDEGAAVSQPVARDQSSGASVNIEVELKQLKETFESLEVRIPEDTGEVDLQELLTLIREAKTALKTPSLVPLISKRHDPTLTGVEQKIESHLQAIAKGTLDTSANGDPSLKRSNVQKRAIGALNACTQNILNGLKLDLNSSL